MALIERTIDYDIHQDPPQEGRKPSFHIRTAHPEVIHTRQLLEEHLNSKDMLNMENALAQLITLIREELRCGNTVHLDGFGSFKLTLSGDVSVRDKEFHGSRFEVNDATIRNITFSADKTMLDAMRRSTTLRYKPSPHSYVAPDEQLDFWLTRMFADPDFVLMRHHIVKGFAMHPKDATRLLERLCRENRLKKHGEKGASFYTPVPGHFGR